MICFRDMTFCDAKCANTKCHRMLTDDVKARARSWWGQPGAPIAVGDLSNGCPKFKPIEEGEFHLGRA